jgi:hypothetical protein
MLVAAQLQTDCWLQTPPFVATAACHQREPFPMTWLATDTRTSHLPVGEQMLAPEAFFSSRNTQLHTQTPWRPNVMLQKLSRASP